MNVQGQLYQDLAQLPPQELAQLLAEVLPYGEIKARMDGSVALIHAYGLRRFQSTADLLELGIPEDDPRNEVFTAAIQSLVPEKNQNELCDHAVKVVEGAKRCFLERLSGHPEQIERSRVLAMKWFYMER